MRFVAPTWFPWRFPCVPRAPNITQRRPHEAQEAPQRSQITSKEDKHLSGNWIHDEIFDFKIDWKTNEQLTHNVKDLPLSKPIRKRSNIDFKATFIQRCHLWQDLVDLDGQHAICGPDVCPLAFSMHTKSAQHCPKTVQ
jgi:hypothetical protein